MPPLERKANQSIAFSLVKKRLTDRLTVLEAQNVDAKRREEERPKTCNNLAIVVDEENNSSNEEIPSDGCDKCDSLKEKLKGLENETAFLEMQYANMQDWSSDLRELENKRKSILDEMVETQKEYNKLIEVSEWHKDDTGWHTMADMLKVAASASNPMIAYQFYKEKLSDPRYRQSWSNLLDDGQSKLANLHNKVLEQRSALQNIKRQKSILQEKQSVLENLSDKIAIKQEELFVLREEVNDCEFEFCK